MSIEENKEVKMATIVTVHGGYGGGWEWKDVAKELSAMGHEVFRPTLTGMGERHHIGRQVGLNTHIQDIVSVIEFEELNNVILSGHSYSGIVVTGVADRIPDRIGLVVYIDAEIPENGQSVFNMAPDITDIMKVSSDEHGDDWFDILEEILPPKGEIDEEKRRRYISRLRPQPVATFTDPIRLTGKINEVRRAFVRCTGGSIDLGGSDPIEPYAEQAKRAGWLYREINTPHDPQLFSPEEMARVLDDLANFVDH